MENNSIVYTLYRKEKEEKHRGKERKREKYREFVWRRKGVQCIFKRVSGGRGGQEGKWVKCSIYEKLTT